MAEPDHVTHVPPDARTPGESTAGMTQEQAIAVDGLWAGLVRTTPGAVSDWHHHGEYETSIYVVTGRLRMESGPGGADVIDAEPGDFLTCRHAWFIARRIRMTSKATSWWCVLAAGAQSSTSTDRPSPEGCRHPRHSVRPIPQLACVARPPTLC